MRLHRRRLLLVALPLVLAAGAALAAERSPARKANGVINACVKKAGGRVRIVRRAGQCRRKERALSWNIEGPAGGRGASGPARAAGAPGRAGPAGAGGAPGAGGAGRPPGGP